MTADDPSLFRTYRSTSYMDCPTPTSAASFNAIPGVTCVEPTGAFYFFFRVDGVTPGHDCTGTLFCDQAMAAGVAMVPGAAFGDDRWVRMSYAASDKDLETALDRIFGLIRKLGAKAA